MTDIYSSDAGWRRRTGVTDEGSAVYEPAPPAQAIKISARIEYGRRLVRDGRGEELLSESTCVTTAEIEPGDVIVHGGREWPVYAVSRVCALGGEELFRECRLYWQRSASSRVSTASGG